MVENPSFANAFSGSGPLIRGKNREILRAMALICNEFERLKPEIIRKLAEGEAPFLPPGASKFRVGVINSSTPDPDPNIQWRYEVEFENEEIVEAIDYGKTFGTLRVDPAPNGSEVLAWERFDVTEGYNFTVWRERPAIAQCSGGAQAASAQPHNAAGSSQEVLDYLISRTPIWYAKTIPFDHADLDVGSLTANTLLLTTPTDNFDISQCRARVTTAFAGAMGMTVDTITVGITGEEDRYMAGFSGASTGYKPTKSGNGLVSAGTEVRAYFTSSTSELINLTSGSVTFWIQGNPLP